MPIYQSKASKISGSNYSEVVKQARKIYHLIAKQTKRKPYVRSSYFQKEKVFFDFFWQHLAEKSLNQRVQRLKYFNCAIDLIKNSRYQPVVKINPNRKSELLYRFTGITPDGLIFYVQIKENARTKQKFFMSTFAEIKNLPPS